MSVTSSKDQETVHIYPDMTHKTRLSSQAREFREAYRIIDSHSRPARARQLDLIVEEFKEFLDSEATLYLSNPKNKEHCLKELADLVYVCYQYAANLGWDLDAAMDRVHKSNMSKLGEDGEPILRGDGKVLKGPNYAPPNLEDLI